MNDILWGIGGILGLLALAWAFSANRSAINWRTVLGALAIQLLFAFMVLFWEPGRSVLQAVSGGVQSVINNAYEGINFLFGNLTNGAAMDSVGFIFAFNVLPIIIFFSSLIAVLYYLGVMQWIIRLLGGALTKLLGTSEAESMSATANIFVGQTEAPLVVKPFLAGMTRSELFAVMVGGLASVAGSTLAGYAGLGVRLDYLIAASFMAAPAGLLMAKMLFPETERIQDYSGITGRPRATATVATPQGPVTLEQSAPATAREPEGMGADATHTTSNVDMDGGDTNVIDAAARGASEGMALALNVGAMLLAFIGLIALINLILGGIGGLFGYEGLTVQLILGWLFAPLATLIGVPWSEAVQAGSFLGQKLVTNEFVAFIDFANALKEGSISPKVEAIVTFALCGFANFSSLGILLGGLGGMAPSRRPDIAQLGMRAIAAGVLANLMSGTIAGMLVALQGAGA
ncbi:NupC/NupG family nucleoside CNT transporter [Deinococcus radiophilus]|uniref:NupC/NupG family nucleoside CNT transporter n=1 Tax=Deinococcus radiophilus TaxID=32062 RepID=A0A3S0KFR9_9DEIO|nr:NupC/NupG family nucleoside CNT transporter [Deinococcus radiophilus]RTR25703.1 NupC/NupG family nucleoside CNT transporter [Deinococcus radiophilus]